LSYKTAQFLIRTQKYLELLEARDTKSALQCLRNEITPIQQSAEKLHLLSGQVVMSLRKPNERTNQLTNLNHSNLSPSFFLLEFSLLMCTDVEEIKAKAKWDGTKGLSRSLLLTNLRRMWDVPFFLVHSFFLLYISSLFI
jgi:transcriptional regulator of aromatic amino acid metabolism